jgi:hypothetical protein
VGKIVSGNKSRVVLTAAMMRDPSYASAATPPTSSGNPSKTCGRDFDASRRMKISEKDMLLDHKKKGSLP